MDWHPIETARYTLRDSQARLEDRVNRTYHDVEQNSDDWYALRCGIATASEFARVLAKGRSGGESIGRRKYIAEIAAERLTGQPTVSYINAAMERGKRQEPEIRADYMLTTDAELSNGGFWTIEIDGMRFGASPDALVGEDGLLEVKSAEPHVLVDCHMLDRFPSEHVTQCQGQLWITGRKWIDICVGSDPNLPPFIRRMEADEGWAADLLHELKRFEGEVERVVRKLRDVGAYDRRDELREQLRASL